MTARLPRIVIEEAVRQAVDLIERGCPRDGVALLRSVVECPPPAAFLDTDTGDWTGPDVTGG